MLTEALGRAVSSPDWTADGRGILVTVTDDRGRVLRADGSVVPGLYATGNSSASMVGAVYPGPGAPLGTAMVFGSLAVQDMAPTR